MLNFYWKNALLIRQNQGFATFSAGEGYFLIQISIFPIRQQGLIYIISLLCKGRWIFAKQKDGGIILKMQNLLNGMSRTPSPTIYQLNLFS